MLTMFMVFSSLLAGGMLVVLSLCPIGQIAWRLIRLIAILSISMFALMLTWSLYEHGLAQGLYGWLALGLQLLGCILGTALMAYSALLPEGSRALIRRVQRLCLGTGTCALLAALLWLWATPLAATHPLLWAVSAIGNLLSAFLLGAVTVGWLMGHRYLTATEMTIDPLKQASQLLFVAVGTRWIFLVVVLLAVLFMPSLTASQDVSLFADWFMLAVRIGVGLAIPSVLAYMAWDCVKLRSTQSATGILFFMSIMVIIGELTSQYLYTRYGLAI